MNITLPSYLYYNNYCGLRRLIWGRRIPLRISIFMWRLLNCMLPCPDIFQPFGFHLPSKCPFCANEEMLQHSFVECRMGRQVWERFDHGLTIHMAALDSLTQKLQGWRILSAGRSLKVSLAHFLC